uniref:Membrane protein ORF59 n=1 Tax=Panagrellus redivivus TaxID=6233 RepID=A0A7E4V5E7_PANRE
MAPVKAPQCRHCPGPYHNTMRFLPLLTALTLFIAVFIKHGATESSTQSTTDASTTVVTTVVTTAESTMTTARPNTTVTTTPSTVETTTEAEEEEETTTAKKKKKELKLETVTIVLCIATVAFWFLTLIVSFVLCMKFKSSQKKRNLPPPSDARLSSRDYQEFSDVPDEANFVEKNSKMQNIKNKMAKKMKRNKRNRAEEGGDEFAM